MIFARVLHVISLSWRGNVRSREFKRLAEIIRH